MNDAFGTCIVLACFGGFCFALVTLMQIDTGKISEPDTAPEDTPMTKPETKLGRCGLSVVWGIKPPKPFQGIPFGRYRLRMREGKPAHVFVKDDVSIRDYILVDNGDYWNGLEVAANDFTPRGVKIAFGICEIEASDSTPPQPVVLPPAPKVT